jgi:predicted alpha/beta hydrolase family esterase
MAKPLQLLLIQGGGADVHDHWDDKLVNSLRRNLGAAYDVHYPRMPEEDAPCYARWAPVIRGEMEALEAGSILVGHSVGGTMMINAFAEDPSRYKPGAIILIASPFVGDDGWPGDEFKLPIDLGTKLPTGLPVHLFHGLADQIVPASHAHLFARAIPKAVVHLLPGRDHQLNNDLSEVASVIRAGV